MVRKTSVAASTRKTTCLVGERLRVSVPRCTSAQRGRWMVADRVELDRPGVRRVVEHHLADVGGLASNHRTRPRSENIRGINTPRNANRRRERRKVGPVGQHRAEKDHHPEHPEPHPEAPCLEQPFKGLAPPHGGAGSIAATCTAVATPPKRSVGSRTPRPKAHTRRALATAVSISPSFRALTACPAPSGAWRPRARRRVPRRTPSRRPAVSGRR